MNAMMAGEPMTKQSSTNTTRRVATCRSLPTLVVALLLGLQATSDASQPQLPRSELFTFHSDAFVNLHHFLYRWAQAGPGADTNGRDERLWLHDDDVARYEAMDDTEREAWDFAVTYYRLGVIARDLLFDDEMVALRDCLVMAGSFCNRIAERDQETLDVLNDVMPMYRRAFWRRHNSENRRWMDEIIPLARRFEADIAPRVAAAYTGEWTEERNRVDVTVYANRVGGYTTADGHITVSSVEPGNQGYVGLELLFHEASHEDDMEQPLRELVQRAFASIGADAPPDLWHMTIFYTAGHVTRDVLEDAGIEYAQTYAELAGIWERRPDNARAKAALDAAWGDAIDAGGGFEEAMASVARAWQQ